MNFLTLLAQAAAEEAPKGGFNPTMIMFFAVVVLAFYFFILKPQKKEQKERQELISSVKKGDKVVTAGGIHGVVLDTSKNDTLGVEVAKGVRMVFNRSSISVVGGDKKSNAAEKSDKDNTKK